MNIYVKNACKGNLISKKNILATTTLLEPYKVSDFSVYFSLSTDKVKEKLSFKKNLRNICALNIIILGSSNRNLP